MIGCLGTRHLACEGDGKQAATRAWWIFVFWLFASLLCLGLAALGSVVPEYTWCLALVVVAALLMPFLTPVAVGAGVSAVWLYLERADEDSGTGLSPTEVSGPAA